MDQIKSSTCRDGEYSAIKIMDWYTKNIESGDQLVERYTETSQQYDKTLEIYNYDAPAKIAKGLSKLFPNNRQNIKILDVAAGTGLCAEECHKLGFRQLDAVDASTGMLQEARKKNLYQKLYTAKLGTDVIGIPDDSYDVITMCGLPAFVQKKLPRAGIEEMIRLAKTGGYIITASNKTVYEEENLYYLHSLQLETERRWERVKMETVHFLDDMPGVLVVHRVL